MPPSFNDNFGVAAGLAGDTINVGPYDLTSNTVEGGEPSGSAGTAFQTAWWRWVPTFSGEATIDLRDCIGNDGVTVGDWIITIWTGTVLGSLTEVASKHITTGDTQLTFPVDIANDDHLYIQIGTFGGGYTTATVVFLLGFVQTVVTETHALYISDMSGALESVRSDGALYDNIGPIKEGANTITVTGMAWDSTTSTLFAVTRTADATRPSALMTINPTTGAATFVGNLGLSGGNSCTDISCSPTGELYGYKGGGSGLLVHINKSTGAGTQIGSPPGYQSGGICFIGSTLYYFPSSTGDPIFTVNLTTGVFTSTGVNRAGTPFGVEGAEYHEGTVYLAYSNIIAPIDLVTGIGGFQEAPIGSLSSIVSIPDPPATVPSRPSNDDYVNATSISGSSGSIAGTTTGAFEDWPVGGVASTNVNVWYKWTAPTDGLLFLTETGGAGQTAFDIWTGSVFETAEPFGEIDLFNPSLVVQNGVQYYIGVSIFVFDAGDADFTMHWTMGWIVSTILATSTVSGAVRHTHQPIVPTTGIAATSTVSGAIQRKRITPTTGITALSTVAGRISRRFRLGPTTIFATSTLGTFFTTVFVYVPPEVFTTPGGPGYPLIGPAAANPDGYFIDSLDHSFNLFQTYRGENLRFKQIISDVQDADWEISNSQVNSKGEPIVWRRQVDNADFILPNQNHFRIRYKESGVETAIMAGLIKSTNGAKGRDFMKVAGVDWMGYLDRRQIPFNPLEPEATYAAANFFGPSTPPTGYSYQVAGRDIYRIVHDILQFVLSKPRSLPLDISDPGTSFMGSVINYALALGDTSTALSLINGLSEYWPGFDFLIGYNRNFAVWSPARYGDPDDTANSGPDGDNIAYKFGDDFNHPVMDIEYTNNGVQATHLLGTGAGSTANRVAKAIGAGDIQRQMWRLDDSVDFGDQAKTQDIVAMRTRREFIFRAREVHEIELTIDPSTVEDFHNVIKVGYAIWLRDDLQFHEIDSAQKIISIEMTVNNQGDRTAVLGLNQIYDTSNEQYGVNEA